MLSVSLKTGADNSRMTCAGAISENVLQLRDVADSSTLQVSLAALGLILDRFFYSASSH